MITVIDPPGREVDWEMVARLRSTQPPPSVVVVSSSAVLPRLPDPPAWVQLVVIPADPPPTEDEARRIGAEHADGDVIRLIRLDELLQAMGSKPTAPKRWLDRLRDDNLSQS